MTFDPVRSVCPAEGGGRTDDFAAFVAARSAALPRTAWLLTGDDGLAEDLLQTAPARRRRRRHRVAAGSNPEARTRTARGDLVPPGAVSVTRC